MKNLSIVIALFLIFSLVGMLDSYQTRGEIEKNKQEVMEFVKRSIRVQEKAKKFKIDMDKLGENG